MLSDLQHELIKTEELLDESKWDERSAVRMRERIIDLLNGFSRKIAGPRNVSEEMFFHMVRSQLRLLEREGQRFRKETRQT